MELRNLTPHVLSIVTADGSIVSLSPTGIVPRRATIRRDGGVVAGLPVTIEALGEVEGLPTEEKGVVLIVSRLVAEAIPERVDLYAPGETIRDASGRIVGARGITRMVPAEIEDTFGSGPRLPEVGEIRTVYGTPYAVTFAGCDLDGTAHVCMRLVPEEEGEGEGVTVEFQVRTATATVR